jgi:predicted amidophosphoribosyltransferase
VIWGEYGGVLRSAILALKHQGRDELAKPLGERLAAAVAMAPWAHRIDQVTSVPSHVLYRYRRSYSAAQLLAHSVAKALGLSASTLLRRHGLGRQARRSRTERLRLAAGSFSGVKRNLSGEALLIDDVTTTGTTLQRAAAALLSCGASTVYCAALAQSTESRSVA